jgi:hypothetical protein
MNGPGATVKSRRPSLASRRVGYVIAGAINVALLYLVNVWPGWSVVPFLTDGMTQVLGIVNVSLVAGLVVNAVYLVQDAAWLKAAGDLVTTAIALAVLARLWQVFPFDFGESTVNWAWLTRSVLVVAIVGCGIGLLVQLVTLVRAMRDHGRGV